MVKEYRVRLDVNVPYGVTLAFGGGDATFPLTFPIKFHTTKRPIGVNIDYPTYNVDTTYTKYKVTMSNPAYNVTVTRS